MIEVVIAAFLLVVLGVPVIWLITGSRGDSCKAINYERALEIAHETIEWVQSSPLDKATLTRLVDLSGSLVDPVKGVPNSSVYGMGSNPKWGSYLEGSLSYPADYAQAFFYRQISIQQVNNSSLDYSPYLFHVIVTISWNEGRTADLSKPDRMKKVQLSTLVLDERRGY